MHQQQVGLGLRRELINALIKERPNEIDFLEIAPENWMNMGGQRAEQLRTLAEAYPIICHGLSLSIGSPAPLDEEFIAEVKSFLDLHQIAHYSEHLSYCSDQQGYLYDLLPLPLTEEAVHYVAGRIRQVQDRLARRIAMENVSYYCLPQQSMREEDFINAVLDEADCDLLLDVNNVYVNSVNHGYDAHAFLKSLPGERIAYIHIAGHLEEKDFLLDTHGMPVSNQVWQLLEQAYALFGSKATLLERDNNVPPLATLLQETACINSMQQKATKEGGYVNNNQYNPAVT